MADDIDSSELDSCSRLILSPKVIKLKNDVVDISRDGKVFAVGNEQLVTIYSTLTFEELNNFTCGAEIYKVKFSPNRKYIACQTSENKKSEVFVYNINESRLHTTIKSDNNFSMIKYSSMIWSFKSKFLWSAWNANFQSNILSIKNNETFHLLGTKLDCLCRPLCTFSPDDNYFLAIQRTLPQSLLVYSTEYFNVLKVYYFEDMNDISGITCLHDCNFYIWDSPVQLNVQMWSLDGKLQHRIKADLFEYGVREVSFSPCGRLLAIMQFEKTEVSVHDTLTWKLVAVLIHNKAIHKNAKIAVSSKTNMSETNFTNESNIFTCNAIPFEQGNKLIKNAKIHTSRASTTKDICRQRVLEFSSCGQYIATYEPEVTNCIWIWNLHAHTLLEALIEIDINDKNSLLPDIKWNTCKPYVAVDLGSDVVLWNQETQLPYVINNSLGTPVKSMWCSTTKLCIAIYTSDRLGFVF